MNQKTNGIVLTVSKQWWLKINTKMVRQHALDGAIFPHIIRVSYEVDGITYTRRRWIHAGQPVPDVGDTVTVVYPEEKPAKSTVLL